MEPLASVADLMARPIDLCGQSGSVLQALLDSASDEVRDAAGTAITYGRSTIVLVATDWRDIDLPAGPVAAVIEVVVNGETVAGWRKIGDTIIMPRAWTRCLPVEVTVTYDHGYLVVPANIVDLVCSMVAMALADDYGSSGRTASVKLGEYTEKFAHPAGTESPSPIALPDSVRERLRARFGSSVAVIGVRR